MNFRDRTLQFQDKNGELYSEWSQKKLKELVMVGKAGGTPSASNKNYYTGVDAAIPFLGISDMTEQGKYLTDTAKSITKEGLDSSSAWVVPAGYLIYAMYASVGKVGIPTKPMATSQALFAMDFKDSVDTEYVYYYLDYFRDNGLKTLITTGTQGNINAETLKSFDIPLPSLPEQKKIAEFFSALDERIALNADKVKLLKEQKQGYLQKVFSRELVFTDDNGDTYGEWEKKKLGEVATALDNQRVPLSSQERASLKGDIPYYGATQIVDYINDFIFDEELVLIGEDGVDFESFRTKPIAQFISGKSWVNNHAHVFRANTNLILSKFLFYSVVHKDVTKYVVGGGRAKLNKSEALKIEIALPAIPEQQKIAEFLSALDQQIELTENKLTLLKEQKKGYLQGIFG